MTIVHEFRVLLVTVVSIASVVLLTWKAVDNYITERYSSGYCSKSIEESRRNSKFIKAVKPTPSNIQIDDNTIRIKECWIEERTQIVHKFILLKHVRRLGSYYLCFTLENNSSADNLDRYYQIRKKGSKYGFAKSKGVVYYDELTSAEMNNNAVMIEVMKKDKTAIGDKPLATVTVVMN